MLTRLALNSQRYTYVPLLLLGLKECTSMLPSTSPPLFCTVVKCLLFLSRRHQKKQWPLFSEFRICWDTNELTRESIRTPTWGICTVKVLHPVQEVWNSTHMKGHSGNWEGQLSLFLWWSESLKLRLWNGDASWTPSWAVKSIQPITGQLLVVPRSWWTDVSEVMVIGPTEPQLSFPWRFYPSLFHGWDQTLWKRK